MALAQENLKICERLLELSKVRRAAGKVADLDVAEANASLNSAQSGLRVAEQLYSEARRNLEVLIGRYPAAEIEVSQTFSILPPPVTPGLPSALLQRRPDVIAAERQVQAAFPSAFAQFSTGQFSFDSGEASHVQMPVSLHRI